MLSESEKEVAKRFIKELTPSEKYIFLNKLKEAIYVKGYTVDEDLFYYCYFFTLKERLRAITPYRTNGFLRYIFAEGLKDIEDSIKEYEERLEKKKTQRMLDKKKIECGGF